MSDVQKNGREELVQIQLGTNTARTPDPPSEAAEPRYWRSLEELAGTPEFEQALHREFPAAAAEWNDDVSRRGFLKLMSASIALAGLTGCTRMPIESIVPYVQQPEEIIPGRPLFFATAMDLEIGRAHV